MMSLTQLLTNMAMFVVVAIALSVTFSYISRPSIRARFPGGAGRYVVALVVQAAGFMIPIPVGLVLLFGRPIPAGVDVALAVAAGVAVLALLHFAPLTGPLLKDLRRTRMEAALARAAGERK